jgi:hypothetical protein
MPAREVAREVARDADRESQQAEDRHAVTDRVVSMAGVRHLLMPIKTAYVITCKLPTSRHQSRNSKQAGTYRQQ